MKRGTMGILLAALVPAILATAVGCAPGKEAVRGTENPSGVAVRLPIVESPDVNLRAEEQTRPGALAEPPSVGDEYRGRWLTLFEVTVTPPEPDGPPAPGPMQSP
jgi:hypothetical protein